MQLGPATGVVMAAAAIVGGLAGALGCFLVLRRQALLADVIAHATLPGVVAGFLLAGARDLAAITPLALLAGLLAALFAQALKLLPGIKADAALAAALSLFFAAGVVALSYAQARPGAAGLNTVLFGQAAAVLLSDLPVLATTAALVLLLLLVLWKELKLVLFDPVQARMQGLPVPLLEALWFTLVALVIVLGLMLVGAVLMVALMIAPAVAARLFVHRLAAMVVLATIMGAGAASIGAVVSAQAGVATGPTMVLFALGLVVLAGLLAPEKGLLARLRRRFEPKSRARVLAALRALAQKHGDLAYPVEEVMLDVALGAPARPLLRHLEREGLVTSVEHPPETTIHWRLTEQGAEDTRQ